MENKTDETKAIRNYFSNDFFVLFDFVLLA